MITRTFKLCLNAGNGSAPYINVNQYDEGETWLFELYSENGERYIPSSGAIVGVKSDGHGIVNTGTVDSEGRVVITETQQMTASAGRAIYELSIDGLTHGTANFIVTVERKPTDDAVMSDSDLSLIQEAVDAATTIEDLIEGHDPDEVIADAVDAWLDAHPEATTTVEDGAITSAKLNDSVKTGVFEDMTVGTSLAVMNDEGVTDNLAYKFRQTGGDAVRELDEIHGGTIAWNQLASLDVNDWSVASTVAFSTSGNAISITSSTSSSALKRIRTALTSEHKYLATGIVNGNGTSLRVGLYNNDTYTSDTVLHATGADAVTMSMIFNATAASGTLPYFGAYIASASATDTYGTIDKCQLFDLTQMFDSTVADAIYAMEQSSAGSGVAYFRSLFPNSYYAYNSGELVSVEGLSSHVTTGFNQWDEEWEVGWIDASTGQPTANSGRFRAKNFTKVFPSTTYYVFCGNNEENYVYQYDAEQNYLGYNLVRNNTITVRANAHYIKNAVAGATTYNNDICINISSSENGTYKPYTKHTYPLDSTLTLRGVPKWNNGLYYDGDIYRHDGSVQRRYGIVDLGSLTWYLNGVFYAVLSNAKSRFEGVCSKYPRINTSVNRQPDKTWQNVSGGGMAIWIKDTSYSTAADFKSAMSGVYLVYELATPTSETAYPYQQYQICDGKGTEEYVSETVTPVGHSTFYPVDIVSKVNKLPSDFSTLIAPTEQGFKATRNYTAKQFLIINNQLYRVTANIANGGTITPNTNVTAVTIADILTTLI